MVVKLVPKHNHLESSPGKMYSDRVAEIKCSTFKAKFPLLEHECLLCLFYSYSEYCLSSVH